MDKPNRTYPRAMAIPVLLVTLAYLLPALDGVSIDTEWANWKEGYFPPRSRRRPAAIGWAPD